METFEETNPGTPRQKDFESEINPEQENLEIERSLEIETREGMKEQEIKLEDVFEYGFDEMEKKLEESENINPEDMGEISLFFSQWKREVKDFSEEDSEKFKEILEKLKDWNSELLVEEAKKGMKISDGKLAKGLYKCLIFSEMVKFEKINPSDKMQKLAEKVILLNGIIDADEMEELNSLDLNEKEIKFIEKVVELETMPEIRFGLAEFIGHMRENKLTEKGKETLQILSDDEKFRKVKGNIEEIKNGFKKLDIDILVSQNMFNIMAEKENLKKILGEAEHIKKVVEDYNLSRIIEGGKLWEFIGSQKTERDGISSEEFKEKIKKFKIKFDELIEPIDAYTLFYIEDEERVFPKKEKEVEKILLDFGIKEIGFREFRKAFSLLPEKEIDEISERDFSNSLAVKNCESLIKNSPYYRQISSEFIENIRKTKGDYQAKTFPSDILKYISSSLLFSYLTFEKPDKENLEKLKENSLKSDIHKKIYNKACSGVLELKDVIPGRKATKKLIEKGNLEYLLVSQKLDIPFDYYGIFGKDIEEIKEEVDARAEELIENYSENKEKYLPYLDALLGYASKYKEEVKELLKIENLWEYKFSHLDDLNSILEEIKDMEMEIKQDKIGEKENMGIYIKNLEEHLDIEEFSKVKQRISVIKEKNQEKALDLIKKMENIVAELLEEKNPEKKDIDTLLSNKAIFKHLGLVLSLESIRQMHQKINKKEKNQEFLKSVEIIKKPEEYLGAMNMNPSCMRVGGMYDYGALTIAQSPILILGVKDNFGKIKGRSLLIPVKDENGKYRFELKNTYGNGEEYIKDFAEKIEIVLREKVEDYHGETEKIITTDFIKGELPKSKKLLSTRQLEFYRDGKGTVEFEEQD